MPWNPVEKYPEVIANLNKTGRQWAAGIYNLENSIISVLGVVSAPSIKRHKEMMRRLGYIRERQDGAVDLCQKQIPFNFAELKPEDEADTLLSKVAPEAVIDGPK